MTAAPIGIPVNPAQGQANQAPGPGALGPHKANNITGKVGDMAKKMGGGAKQGMDKIKGGWSAMSRKERGYYIIAALCLLLALALLITLGVLFGPAALIPAFMLVAPLLYVGIPALAMARSHTKLRKSLEVPKFPKSPKDFKDEKEFNSWKDKWDKKVGDMLQAREKMRDADRALEYEKERLRLKSLDEPATNVPDLRHQMVLQAALPLTAHKYMVAKAEFDAFKKEVKNL